MLDETFGKIFLSKNVITYIKKKHIILKAIHSSFRLESNILHMNCCLVEFGLLEVYELVSL